MVQAAIDTHTKLIMLIEARVYPYIGQHASVKFSHYLLASHCFNTRIIHLRLYFIVLFLTSTLRCPPRSTPQESLCTYCQRRYCYYPLRAGVNAFTSKPAVDYWPGSRLASMVAFVNLLISLPHFQISYSLTTTIVVVVEAIRNYSILMRRLATPQSMMD